MSPRRSFECANCGLPDNYNGDGDGIGSCDCSRCEDCGAAPLMCSCDDEYEDTWGPIADSMEVGGL